MITKDLLRALRIDLDAALVSVGQKHGITIKAGNARFSAETATFKLDIATLQNGQAIDIELLALKQVLGQYGLTEVHVNQVFKLGTHSFTLAGYRPRARAKPFLIKRLDNDKSYIIDESALKRALGVAPKSVFAESRYDVCPGQWDMLPGELWQDWNKRIDKMMKDLEAEGTPIIRFSVADGYAQYLVKSLSPLQLQHIPYGDAYRIPDAHLRGLTSADVSRMIEGDKRMKELFAKKA